MSIERINRVFNKTRKILRVLLEAMELGLERTPEMKVVKVILTPPQLSK